LGKPIIARTQHTRQLLTQATTLIDATRKHSVKAFNAAMSHHMSIWKQSTQRILKAKPSLL
jgi:hypothetical protein